MPLIKCPKCGRDVECKVRSCPNCGYQFNNKQTIANTDRNPYKSAVSYHTEIFELFDSKDASKESD